jgi:3-deoxy-D-manno-octulosonic-acid transferase
MILYNLLIFLYVKLIQLFALNNTKASKWTTGRANWQSKLAIGLSTRKSKTIWIHCASLGEFEQGRPIIESIKKIYPETFILLTFFSPSGYEVRKNYVLADFVCYLPADTPKQAKQFINIVQPELVFFVKYEFWLNMLEVLKQKNIPVLLTSAIFRENQIFFKWYGGLWRNALRGFKHIFVQNQESATLLASIQLKNFSIGGDTRFDRVLEIANQFIANPQIEKFCNKKSVLVAGSTWTEDEILLSKLATAFPKWKMIIAPHEIDENHLSNLEKSFQQSCRFSALINLSEKELESIQILIIDNIGMLSKLYNYANICYVGGGFGSGIHNVLEAAVYGKPVLFGPKFHKFDEAKALIKAGGAFTIQDEISLFNKFSDFKENSTLMAKTGSIAGNFVHQNAGATALIIDYIKKNDVLPAT